MRYNKSMENLENVKTGVNPLEDVLFIVLLNKNEDMKVKAPYDIEILGKKMWQWVALAGDGAKIKTTPCTEESDIVNLIKPFVGNEKYTMVFYSDTPLLSRSLVMEILEYFQAKDLNVLKLERGFVFNSEYLLNCEKILAGASVEFSGNDFEAVDSYQKLTFVTEKLRDMILDYHMTNGVYVVDPKTTFVDADVVIEKGVRIEPNNVVKGETYIGEYSTLEANNIIKDSIISKNVIVKNSYISGSRISENMIVGPFDAVIDKSI